MNARCERLRSLHRPGNPLVLPNAWDVPTARAVAAAGFPAVATTSGGVAGALGYEDHQGAPAEEMLEAAARIGRAVDVPVTVDAEAGYGMNAAELADALRGIGAAGCNLEDTEYEAGRLRDLAEHAGWLRAVREAASRSGYGLVINARIDAFLSAFHAGSEQPQLDLVPEALERARAYVDAGADCVFPIALWQPDALAAFLAEAPGPVNVLALPNAPPVAELARLGVARISFGTRLYREAMGRFEEVVQALAGERRQAGQN